MNLPSYTKHPYFKTNSELYDSTSVWRVSFPRRGYYIGKNIRHACIASYTANGVRSGSIADCGNARMSNARDAVNFIMQSRFEQLVKAHVEENVNVVTDFGVITEVGLISKQRSLLISAANKLKSAKFVENHAQEFGWFPGDATTISRIYSEVISMLS